MLLLCEMCLSACPSFLLSLICYFWLVVCLLWQSSRRLSFQLNAAGLVDPSRHLNWHLLKLNHPKPRRLSGVCLDPSPASLGHRFDLDKHRRVGVFFQGKTKSSVSICCVRVKLTSCSYDDLSQVVSIKREIKGKCYSLWKQMERQTTFVHYITPVNGLICLTAAFRCVLDRMLWIWTWLLCRDLRSTQSSSVLSSVGPKFCHL